jgi:phage gp29-like protein
MLRGLTPERLGRALDAYDAGDLGQAAQLWQSMATRDDVISSVKPKREKAISRRDWQILTVDDSRAALRQQAVLQDFWGNIRAVDALSRHDRGGIAKLIRQMMTAVSYGFASHHLVWQPSRDRLSCEFEFVPLHFFENRTGELRFRETGLEYSGKELAPNEWMVTTGDALMIAGSIGYLVKRNSLADWMVFSEKFGVPGVVGRTNQGKGTEGGDAMAEAVETYMNDWAAVLYGDDGSGKIDLIEAKGGNTLPFPMLIERVDRRLAALWRGADLSSMSSGSGEGTGASLQREEMDLIEADDALIVSEKLNEVERLVLEWHFGRGVKPLAYIRLSVPQREDLKLLLEAVTRLVEMGAKIGIDDVLERFGIEQPKADDDLLQSSSKAAARPDPEETLDPETQINAKRDRTEERFLAKAGRLLANARVTDHAAMVEELKDVLRSDDATLLNALSGFITRLPESVGQDAAQVEAWETLLASSLVNGLALGRPDPATAE